MKNCHAIIARIFVLLTAAFVAGAGYFLVPPPRHAAASFESQSSWGGTGGGSANAQTISIANVQSLRDIVGVPLRYVPLADNTGPATIAINGLAATAVRRPSNIGLVALSGAELQAGVTMTVMYDGSVVEILGPVDMTPIGQAIEFRGPIPLRGSLIEDGSCISRATYAPLFSVIGTSFGACDGSTTFAIPDSKGTMFAALDSQGVTGPAGRITAAVSGCNANAIGLCGSQSQTLTAPQLPAAIPYTDPGHHHTIVNTNAINGFTVTVPGSFQFATSGSGSVRAIQAPDVTLSDATVNITINPSGGQAHPILNPISLGRRAIKF